MDEKLYNLSYKEAEVNGEKKEILIIQGIESSDLKGVKAEIKIAKPQS